MSVKLDLLSSILKNASGEKLFHLLKTIEGKKDLIIDDDLIRSLDYIASFTQLKACNVEKVFKLEPGPAPGLTPSNVYLIKPSVQNAKVIADHINASVSVDSPKKFWVINVPRKLYACDSVFEREGVYEFAEQMELPLGFLCLDKDLFSLENSAFYTSYFLDGDLTHIHSAAMALVQLCKICGPIPKIYGQGECAKMVLEHMEMISNEISFGPSGADKISHLIVLDRNIDYVSVLLSQLTYEGMLDEFFGIESGRIVFPKSVTGKDSIKVVLNSTDVIFEEIRHNYFASVFGCLRHKAKELQTKSATSDMSIEDMKTFVAKDMRDIKQQQTALILHIGACEVIMGQKSEDNFQERLRIERDILEGQNFIDCLMYTDDCIMRMDPYCSSLRLMCLLSVSHDGLPPEEYDTLCTQFRHSYGCKYMSSIFKLKRLGILTEQAPLIPQNPVVKSKGLTDVATSKATKIAEKVATAVAFPKTSSFKTIARRFSLIPPEDEKIDLKNPKHLSYVFGGTYVPLAAKITEQIVVNDDLYAVEESTKLISVATIRETKTEKETGEVKAASDGNTKTVLVYMLGGITFAEIAALRLIGKLHNCKILIATTSFISAGSLFKMLSPSDWRKP